MLVIILVNMLVWVTCTVPLLVVVENDVLELVAVADVLLVLSTVCRVVVEVERLV